MTGTDQADPPGPRRSWWGPLWPLGEALRFLTLLPIPGLAPSSEQAVIRSVPFAPLAGAIIGGLLALLGLVAGALWAEGVRPVVLVIGWMVLTAGLHLDGLSDTFDAVASWRPRERKLEIMRDSRIGVMGALALLAVILLKITWLGALGSDWPRGIVLAPILGRWADIYGIVCFPAAREGGLGKTFHESVRRAPFYWVTLGVVIVAAGLAGWRGLMACAAVWAGSAACGRWWTRSLGGLTGDTYGALCELGEVITLACLAMRLPFLCSGMLP